MSGMPLLQAFALLVAAIVVIAATQPRRLHPFLAITIVATAFGFAVGFSTGFVGKTFGTGFTQAIYAPGLVIVAAGFIAALADSSGAAERLARKIARWRWLGSSPLAALAGLVAGAAASPTAAFALLTPLFRVFGDTQPRRRGAAVTVGLSISASHGLYVFTPVPVAAASILGAGWGRVALFGVPVALLTVGAGAAWARWVVRPNTPSSSSGAHAASSPAGRGSAVMLFLAVAIPLLMLIFQSLGDIPSEPLGSGPKREMVLATGRPLILLLVALGIMVIGHLRLSAKLFTDSGWTARVFAQVAGVLLAVGAAGGLQRLCQETGMAELLGERMLGLQVGGVGALLVPFVVAAVVKTLQGSSLVAAITAAGMLQPMLAPLGLAGANATALAALAVGAGAMTASHVNDDYFWLVTLDAGLTTWRGFVAITLGTLLQGLVAVAALIVLAALFLG